MSAEARKWIITHMLINIWAMLKSLLLAIPLGVLVGIVTILAIKKYEKKKSKIIDVTKRNVIVLFCTYVALMLQMAIIFRTFGSINEIDLIPFDAQGGFRYIVLYGIANAFVFLPVGILLPMIWKKMNDLKKILLAGFLGSLFIEICQLVLQCGVCQTEDLIMNTVGAGVGYWIYKKVIDKH